MSVFVPRQMNRSICTYRCHQSSHTATKNTDGLALGRGNKDFVRLFLLQVCNAIEPHTIIACNVGESLLLAATRQSSSAGDLSRLTNKLIIEEGTKASSTELTRSQPNELGGSPILVLSVTRRQRMCTNMCCANVLICVHDDNTTVA